MNEQANAPAPRLVEVYRSPRREDTYLYVERSVGLTKVPEPLLERFGRPESVLTLRLAADRKLARATGAQVLQALDAQGFFLQLPPQPAAATGAGAGDDGGGS
jgi:uncharacterized protein YcgL (UPF0745 family)